MRVLAESFGCLGPCDLIGAVGNDGELVPVFSDFRDADRLDALNLSEGAADRFLASGALDPFHARGVGGLSGKDRLGEKQTQKE